MRLFPRSRATFSERLVGVGRVGRRGFRGLVERFLAGQVGVHKSRQAIAILNLIGSVDMMASF